MFQRFSCFPSCVNLFARSKYKELRENLPSQPCRLYHLLNITGKNITTASFPDLKYSSLAFLAVFMIFQGMIPYAEYIEYNA